MDKYLVCLDRQDATEDRVNTAEPESDEELSDEEGKLLVIL